MLQRDNCAMGVASVGSPRQDPKRRQGGSKFRSAAVPCHIEMCYPSDTADTPDVLPGSIKACGLIADEVIE